jgi:cytochrome c oxidase subunit 2
MSVPPTPRRQPRTRPRRARLLLAVGALATAAGVLAGCSGDQSALDPRSGASRNIATLWWWMLGIGSAVFLGAVVLLLMSWRRRNREGLPLIGKRERAETGLVVVFGIAIPVIVLSGLFGVSNFAVMSSTDAPAPKSTQMTIEIIGHQWFWEVRYPGTKAVTANEIHIPARTRVNVLARTADVIHSLWVPQLNRKVDTIPGRTNRLLWYADKPGRYRGQCAEFCGLQHAHMSMYVYADPPDKFRAWLDHMAQPRVAPSTPEQKRGEQVFLSEACASCHTMRGTSAKGQIGPDLTHLQTRSTLAALTIPNRKGYLAGWVLDPQHVKPGNKMPGLNLSGPDFQALLTYLESLK